MDQIGERTVKHKQNAIPVLWVFAHFPETMKDRAEN